MKTPDARIWWWLSAAAVVACTSSPPSPASPPAASAAPEEASGEASGEGGGGGYAVIGILPDSTLPLTSPPSKSTPRPPLRPVPSVAAPLVSDVTTDPPPTVLAAALEHLGAGRLAEATKAVDAVLAGAGSDAWDVRLQALVVRGRILRRAKNNAKADAANAEVLAARGDAEAWAVQQASAGATPRARHVAQALGEALFMNAEGLRAKADARVRPKFPKPLSADAYKRFIDTEMKQWITDKRAAIDAADRAYVAILSVKPASPPGWSIAAAARNAGLWAGFVRDMRTVPLPDEWAGEGNMPNTDITRAEIREAFLNTLADATEPQLASARAGYRFCRDHASKSSIDDAFSRSCVEWLNLDAEP